MDERGIIIADKDDEYSSQVADHFRKAGYRVETTDSAIHVLCSILEKKTPVLLLGSDFDKKVSSADLIHLLKKCNRHLHVIMVSDEMPLALARRVRQEGIFYHALKPADAGDTEELGLAVACAFEKNRTSGQIHHEERPQTVISGDCTPNAEPAQPRLKALPWMIGLVALLFVTNYLPLVATQGVGDGNNMGIWLLLGFCALIIATQLLPIFRIKLPFKRSAEELAKQQSASRDKK
jgi:FixJ family two-component response regulator